MGKHVALSICDYNRKKLCDLYDSSVASVQGQAFDIVHTSELKGWKEVSFVLPYWARTPKGGKAAQKNFRWDYVKNERQLRYTEDGKTDWFLVSAPKHRHDAKGIDATIKCDHISAVLKNKNLYLVFDDTNGIGTITELAKQALETTGWTLGECDRFYESDGKTEKVRTLRSDGKLGAYQLIQNICEQFSAYPVFDGDQKTVSLYSLNRRNAQMELTIGKNIVSIEKNIDSNNVVTRLYVEGEYTEDGYVGIDDVNPTGLPFLTDFSYYKDIGMFTEEHEKALDAYLNGIAAVKLEVMTLANEKTEMDNRLNELWGQMNYVLFVLEGGRIARTIYGGETGSGDEVFTKGDIVSVLHNDGTYTMCELGESPSVSFGDQDAYLIKYITRAAGLIGGKEVAVEAKEKVIASLEKDLQKEYVSESKKEEIRKQIQVLRQEIELLYTGSEESAGLYAMMFEAAELAIEATEKQNEINAANETQNKIEMDFVETMGDMLKDGYWNNSNYVVGQEANLYNDALEIMKDLAKPSATYTVSTALLKRLTGYEAERFEQNTSIRVYDEEMGINDFVYVSKVTHYPDTEEKDGVDISNEYINIQGKTFESVLSRITQLADILNVRKGIYNRADAIGADGSVPALRLEGTIDMLKTKLFSTVSNWYTDENGNIIFEAVNGKSAMQQCGEGFMIANGRNEDGSWNWRTFGTGEGFTADAIITGYLSADRIEAGSITSTKLDGSVGAMIDLSDNESIKMIVNEAASVIRSDEEPEEKVQNMLWLDTSGEYDVLKRWDVEQQEWIECVLSQADQKEIYNDLVSHESSITQMGSEITSKVSADVYEKEMADKANTGWVTQQQDSVMQQTASDIVFQFNEAKAFMAESVEPLETFRDTVSTWQKFSADGLEQGKSDSPFKVKLSNEQLSFLQDNSTVAYINNNKMHITQARVTDTQSIGTENNGYFDWITTETGLALKWRS